MAARRRMTIAWTLLALMAWGAASSASMPEGEDGKAGREVRLRAAFIERLLHFVTWPDEKSGAGPLYLGVIGDDVMAAMVASLGHEDVDGRELVVVAADDPAELAARCHVIYICSTLDGEPRTGHPVWYDLRGMAADHVLTIGDDEAFNADGGVFRFYEEGGRLRFAVSRGAVARAGLTIGSRVMRLALVVE